MLSNQMAFWRASVCPTFNAPSIQCKGVILTISIAEVMYQDPRSGVRDINVGRGWAVNDIYTLSVISPITLLPLDNLCTPKLLWRLTGSQPDFFSECHVSNIIKKNAIQKEVKWLIRFHMHKTTFAPFAYDFTLMEHMSTPYSLPLRSAWTVGRVQSPPSARKL